MVSRHGRPVSVRQRARYPRFAGSSQRDAGYNLVVLVMAVTTLNILVAKALPLWSAVIQREKEAELIFRGMQYAEALRVYQLRHNGQLPVKLEQLIEEDQNRCIRQLWKNPLDENGAWELIPAGQGRPAPGQPPQGGGQDRGQGRGDSSLPGDPSKPDPSLLWIPGGEEQRIGSFQISGVKSPVGDQAIKTFVTNPSAPDGGSNEISEWLFTVELAAALGQYQADGANPTAPSMNVEQRFKPWPPGIKPIKLPAPPQRGNDPRNQGERGNG